VSRLSKRLPTSAKGSSHRTCDGLPILQTSPALRRSTSDDFPRRWPDRTTPFDPGAIAAVRHPASRPATSHVLSSNVEAAVLTSTDISLPSGAASALQHGHYGVVRRSTEPICRLTRWPAFSREHQR
jgi:hypothetical protein